MAADVVVQLRYPFNGETSAALIRALAAGAACITSDMPSMAELPNSVTWKVRSPGPEVADLTAALTRLARHPELRDQLGANARRYAAEVHAPSAIASRYAAAIRESIAQSQAHHGQWLNDAANALAKSPKECRTK